MSILSEIEAYRGSEEHWWERPKNDAHDEVFAAVRDLDERQSYIRNANLHNVRMYSNRMASGLYGDDYMISDFGARMRINAVKAVIDTATAQIASNRAMPEYLTEGGDPEQRERTSLLNQWVRGSFQEHFIDELSVRGFQHAGIMGTGHVKVVPDVDRIVSEHVFHGEIVVDDVESRSGHRSTRTLYQVKDVAKATLLRHPRWGKSKRLKEAIGGATLLEARASWNNSLAGERCHIIEAWRLPSRPGADDGRHVVAISTATLGDSVWKRPGFPFASFRITEAPLGYNGIGFAEELTPFQIEINYLIEKIQVLMNLSTTKFAIKRGEDDYLDNEDMGTIYYKNTAPQVLNVQPVHQQIIDYMWGVYAKCFEVTGVSYSAASSQVQQHLKSGEAIKRATEIGSRRFQHISQAYERFRVEIGDLFVDAATELQESGCNVCVTAIDGDKAKRIDFSEVKMDRSKYVTRVFPASLLPDTPQGKIDTIESLGKAFPELGAKALGLLTGMPDIKSVVDRIQAPQKLVDDQIAAMLRGEPRLPDPGQNLALALGESLLAMQEAISDEVPAGRIELLRRFADTAQVMLQSTQQMMGPQPGPDQSGQPPGQAQQPAPPAGAPPVSMM